VTAWAGQVEIKRLPRRRREEEREKRGKKGFSRFAPRRLWWKKKMGVIVRLAFPGRRRARWGRKKKKPPPPSSSGKGRGRKKKGKRTLYNLNPWTRKGKRQSVVAVPRVQQDERRGVVLSNGVRVRKKKEGEKRKKV